MTELTKGTRVRFTAGPLGLVCDINARGFEPESVSAGDEGVYRNPHPQLADWHVIEVVVSNESSTRSNSFALPPPTGWSSRVLLCPCHESQFEVIT